MPGIHGFWLPQKGSAFEFYKTRLVKGAKWDMNDPQYEIALPEIGLFALADAGKGLPLTRINLHNQVFALMYGELYPVNAQDQQKMLQQLVERFLADGEKALQTVDGLFLIVIFERSHNRLTIINDHFGSLPLNYHWNNGRFLFSSHFASLFALDSQFTFDPDSLLELVTVGFPLNGRTILKDVQRLWPGTVLSVTSSKIEAKDYFEPRFKPVKRPSKQLKQEILETFDHALSIRLAPSETLIAALSGGLDSRAIWAYLLHKQIPAKVYTHGLSDSADFLIASRITEHFNLPALRFPLDDFPFAQAIEQLIYFTEGYMHPEVAFLLDHYRQFQDQPVTLLDGAGGSLYRRQLKRFYIPILHDRHPLAYFLFSRSVKEHFFRTFFDERLWPEVRRSIMNELETYVQRVQNFGTNEDLLDLFHLQLSAALKYSADLLLQSYFVKVRQPFYDRKLFELARQTPPFVRKRLIFHRTIIEHFFPALTRFPLETRDMIIPYRGFRFWRTFPLLLKQFGMPVQRWVPTKPLVDFDKIARETFSHLLPQAVTQLNSVNFLPLNRKALQNVLQHPEKFSATDILKLVNLGNMIRTLNLRREEVGSES